jgi:hypothetical protein
MGELFEDWKELREFSQCTQIGHHFFAIQPKSDL